MKDILMVLWGAAIASGWWAKEIYGDGVWTLASIILSCVFLFYIQLRALEVIK